MRGFLAPFALTALIVGAGCRPAAPSRSSSPDRPNVLLVTIDTLRADHVGCYGHKEASTPTIDALAGRGVRFETAVAHAPLTGPSHASILTGRIPLGHGFRNNSGFTLSPQVRTAAEDFRQAGYRTAAFVSGFPLDRRFGFDRGFDTYDDHLPKGNDRRRTPYVERFADATTDARASLAGRTEPSRVGITVVPLGPLLRSARAIRAAGGSGRARTGRRRTTARSRSSIGSCAAAARARGRQRNGANGRRWSPRITARAWVNTARGRMASSSMTPRFACRG